MYHLVYLTRNLLDNKIYVGKHSTWNFDDGYLGSGKELVNAIKKYGKENFERTIIHYCLDEYQLYVCERQIVDENFVARKDTYNLKLGGVGGSKKYTLHNMSITNRIKMADVAKQLAYNPKVKHKRKQTLTGKLKTKEHAMNISKGKKGIPNILLRKDKNPNAKSYIFISPNNIMFNIKGEFGNFCKVHSLQKNVMYSSINKGIIKNKWVPHLLRSQHTLNCIGWEVKRTI